MAEIWLEHLNSGRRLRVDETSLVARRLANHPEWQKIAAPAPRVRPPAPAPVRAAETSIPAAAVETPPKAATARKRRKAAPAGHLTDGTPCPCDPEIVPVPPKVRRATPKEISSAVADDDRRRARDKAWEETGIPPAPKRPRKATGEKAPKARGKAG